MRAADGLMGTSCRPEEANQVLETGKHRRELQNTRHIPLLSRSRSHPEEAIRCIRSKGRLTGNRVAGSSVEVIVKP